MRRTKLLRSARVWKGGVVILLLLLIAGLRLAEYFVLRYNEEHFESVLDKKCADYLARAERDFSDAQRSTRRVATEVALNPIVLDYLSGRSQDPVALFGQVSRMAQDQEVGVEVYDREANLAAWDGRSGPVHRREVHIALDGQLISYVNRTPVSSQLFVATPVRENTEILGVVLVRRTIDVNYPLNNRYIHRGGLTEQLQADLGVNVTFNFAPGAEVQRDGRYASSVLYGIDSSRVGVVSVLRPAPSALLEGIASRFQAAEAILYATALLLAAAGIWSIVVRRVRRRAFRWLAAAVLIWTVRYGLLWLDVPSSFLSSGIFDPANFASSFGFGIVKSIGEATLTICALSVMLVYAGYLLLSRPRSFIQPATTALEISLRAVLGVVIAGGLFWVLRGYGAVVRGMVFDSSVRYADPRVILPSLETAVMALNLFLFTSCVIAVCTGAAWLIVLCLSKDGKASPRLNGGWWLAALLLFGGALVFGFLGERPLLPAPYRAAVSLTMLAFAFLLVRSRRRVGAVATPSNAVITLALSALISYPIVDLNIHEKDRVRVEGFAQEVLRPVDGWFRFIVDDALRTFQSPQTVDVLQLGDEDETYRLAFTCWAQSLACREGYTSLFAITDTMGRDISRFVIGSQSAVAADVDTSTALTAARSIRVHEVGTGVNALKVYAGTIPIFTPDSALIGYGRAVIAGGQQALFRGENPSILRSASQEDLRSFYRPLTLSEFRGGVLMTSNNPALPVGYTLPPDVSARFTDPSIMQVWTTEVVDDKAYETLFSRSEAGSKQVVALSMPTSGPAWHMAGIVRVFIHFAIVSGLVLAGFFAIAWARGRRYVFTFRDRLLTALLITAFVPLGILTVYGRLYARERLMYNMAERLQGETNTIVQNLDDQFGTSDRLSISPLAAEQLASDLGTDFNLYVENELKVSSRPELYEAGILDTRMSGSAFANMMLKGKRFYLETERIGMYQYAVGYRPVINPSGVIAGVVSVPTLYRQDELDAEVSTRNAFIFGVYILVLIAMILVATTFANRIAAPIQRLTEATRRVARGELDVDVRVAHADGEIGELVESFGRMTRDLQRSREELIKYERELAWKEMAKQVAHEIKNPLTPMKLAIQHLRAMYRDRVPDFGDVLDEVTQTIVTQIDTLSRIASEFSHFARMPKSQPAPCDVNAILEESVRLFDKETGVAFTLDLAPGLPVVMADAEELRRAFINIFRNAVQAMDGKGSVSVASILGEEQIRIVVQDTGPGIPEEMKDRLFQPNFSTKTEGMGLGLAIVKKTIDDLHGTIDIESPPGEGTTVTIILPVSTEGAS